MKNRALKIIITGLYLITLWLLSSNTIKAQSSCFFTKFMEITTVLGQHETYILKPKVKISIENDSLVKQNGRNWYLVTNFWEIGGITYYDLMYISDNLDNYDPDREFCQGILDKRGLTLIYYDGQVTFKIYRNGNK